jgi:hypothetical protein
MLFCSNALFLILALALADEDCSNALFLVLALALADEEIE